MRLISTTLLFVVSAALLAGCSEPGQPAVSATTPLADVAPAPAAPPPPPPPQGIKLTSEQLEIITILYKDDIATMARAGDSMIAPSENILPISAGDVVKAYRENELAADEKFKGKRVAVSGTIRGIKKDVTGTPFVMLHGPGLIDDVIARFPDTSLPLLAKLKAGDKATLLCSVRGERVTLVVLHECQLREQFEPELLRLLQTRAEAVASLKTAGKDDPLSAMMITFAVGERRAREKDPTCVKRAPKSGLCYKSDSDEMQAAWLEMHKAGIDMKTTIPEIEKLGR